MSPSHNPSESSTSILSGSPRWAGATTHAYPVEGAEEPINDVVSGNPIVVLPHLDGASVYSATVDGDVLEFELRDGDYADVSTGSVWSADGKAVSGALAGTSLEPVPSRTTFWFAMWVRFPI